MGDRLLAIFYFIVGQAVPPLWQVESALCGLAGRGILARTTVLSRLDAPKFKCPLSLDMASMIAHSLQFDLGKYLLDLHQ